ncbi:MAG: ABC transporter ATP-binding protein [Hadesarchaea archaeon]|nr:ABC transporter ATP-binding protein [Hadesarchaea archaeon]
MDKNALVVKNLKGYYRGTFGVVHAVDGVSLKVDEGERVGIAGESGCGKSSFAQLITGTTTPLLHYEGGQVKVYGYDIWKISPEKMRKEVKCKLMSYVPQAMLNSLNPTKRVREFIADMMRERTGRKYSIDEVREMAIEHFERLGLDGYVLDVYPHELSGGMAQRVITAISTLGSPKLLITDEPTSALDVTSQKRMIKLMIDIQREGIIKSLICISHDLAALNQLCDRIVIMYAGVFVEDGRVDEVINNPFHPYTRMLMDSLLPLEPETKDKELSSISGVVPDLRNPPPGCRFHPRCDQCMEICTRKEPPEVEKDGRIVKCWLYTKIGEKGKRVKRHLERR